MDLETKSSTTTVVLQSTLASEDDRPIFSRQKVSHDPPHPITHLVASNFQVILVLANKTLQRINQAAKKNDVASSIENIDFSKVCTGSKVHHVSLDPLGAHLIISLQSSSQPEMIYLNKRSQKIRMSSKAKGHLISASAWCTYNDSDITTGPILLGTSRGIVFEAEIDSREDKMFSTSIEKHWKPLINLSEGHHQPTHLAITGLAYFRVEGTKNYFVLLTTANRLYQFVGKISSPDERPLLMSIFNKQERSFEDRFLELPSSLSTSSLSFAYITKESGKPFARHPLFPKSFGWASEPGIYSGNIDSSFSQGDTVTVDCQLLRYSEDDDDKTIPLSIVLTEFHVIMIYKHRVKGVCLLNHQVVFDSEFDPAEGGIKGVSRDPINGCFYVHSDYVVYKFKVNREERNVWRIYLDRGEFELAQKYSLKDPIKINQVFTQQADFLFNEKRYIESAVYYAKTDCSFEQIALKFMDLDDKHPLINFLKKKLSEIHTSETIQMTLLVVWIVENYLVIQSKFISQGNTQEAEKSRDELMEFLQTPRIAGCVEQNKNTIYNLLSSHGDQLSIVNFSHTMKDFDRIIRYYIQNNEHGKALRILQQQKKPELFFHYGPEIMTAMPEKFIDAVIEQGKLLLPPTKLIPALVSSSHKDQEIQAIRYLEFCIYKLGRKETVIHNFLISLYVNHRPDSIEDYLNSQGYDLDNIPYDLEYILCLLEQNNLRKSTIILYCMLDQLDEAVEIALEVDLEKAESCLKFAKNDEDRRQIWLKIAQYVVTQKKDIRQAMEYLKRSNNLINIEDILPFFPDFVTINHFKDAICEALEKYSNHIEDLKKEMEESSKTSDEIRSEIRNFKDRYTFVQSVDRCCICKTYLMSKAFYLFNCGHKFHSDCLIKEVMPYLTPARRKRVEKITSDIKSLDNDKESINKSSTEENNSSKKISKKDQLRSDLDDLIASECFNCGEIMIRMIDQPLIENNEFEEALQEWL